MKMLSKMLAVIGLSVAVSTPAMAWGDREQGILAGAAGLWAIQQLNRVGQQPPVVYQGNPAPVYQAPPPVYYPQPSYTYRPMYRAVDVFDSGCQCYRTVMVQIN